MFKWNWMFSGVDCGDNKQMACNLVFVAQGRVVRAHLLYIIDVLYKDSPIIINVELQWPCVPEIAPQYDKLLTLKQLLVFFAQLGTIKSDRQKFAGKCAHQPPGPFWALQDLKNHGETNISDTMFFRTPEQTKLTIIVDYRFLGVESTPKFQCSLVECSLTF